VVLDDLAEVLERLRETDRSALADSESIVSLQRSLASMEAIVTEATAAFDAAGNFVPDGALTAGAWITAKCRVPRGEARRRLHRGRELRFLPETARAWAAGEITGAHVDVMISLRGPQTEEALARDEAMLVDQARKLTFAHFTRAAAYWRQLADPDGCDQEAERRRARRDVYLVQSFRGSWLGAMNLDPLNGTIVSEELERLEHQLFEADRAEAREILGRDPGPGDHLARTPGQRRADALVEMAIRSKSTPHNARKPAPLFTVLVGWETLHGRICQLENGTVVPPGSLLPWLDRADLERAVFAPGRRIEISPTNRLFTGATRRAIEVRDRECTHPFCEVTAPFCQVDHIQPWALGGPTLQENGRLLCPRHNGRRNERPPPVVAA